jgi:hypothetical protein
MQEPQSVGQFSVQNLQYLLRHLKMLLAERRDTFQIMRTLVLIVLRRCVGQT